MGRQHRNANKINKRFFFFLLKFGLEVEDETAW